MKPTVYLAGPITGLGYDDATDWREIAKDWFQHHGIHGLSPLRGKDYLAGEIDLSDRYDDHPMSTSQAITGRDRWDCCSSDLVLVNMLGASRVSIGTVMEIAWADMARNPICLIMEDNSNIHEHAMIRTVITWRVSSLEDGLEICRRALT